jgi:hypothetical protein
MDRILTHEAKIQLASSLRRRYQAATSKAKKQILSEFVAVSGYHPKYAIHLLNAAEPSVPARRGRRRPTLYDDAAKQALIVLWEASDRICGKRLKPLLRILLPSLERHGHLKLDEAIRAKVLAIVPDVRKQSTAAHEAVRRIDELYAIEREIGAMTDAERVAVRREKSLPLLESLHAWANDLLTSTLASGKLGEALVYLRNQWPKLIRYVDHGEVAIDTNLAENAIRPFALGRRNWMFADTVSGAKASASLYSLVQTARANEIEPYAYLRQMLAELPKAQTVEQIEALLPWDIKPNA